MQLLCKGVARSSALCVGLVAGILAISLACGDSNAQTFAAAKLSRYALVIGNKSYRVAPLENAVNDALLMEKVLRQAGFEVTIRTDLSREQINTELEKFAIKARGAEAALFYFSGHGVQDRGRNYLLPIDAVLKPFSSIPEVTVSVDKVLDGLERLNAPVKILILDACREPPYEGGKPRSLNQGLRAAVPARGTMIAFSTSPGEIALDGKRGGNSVFTQALAESMLRPQLTAEAVFKEVREVVAKKSDWKQVPWLNSGLTGDFYFFVDRTSN